MPGLRLALSLTGPILLPAVLFLLADVLLEAAQKQADAPVVYRGARIHTAAGPVI